MLTYGCTVAYYTGYNIVEHELKQNIGK